MQRRLTSGYMYFRIWLMLYPGTTKDLVGTDTTLMLLAVTYISYTGLGYLYYQCFYVFLHNFKIAPSETLMGFLDLSIGCISMHYLMLKFSFVFIKHSVLKLFSTKTNTNKSILISADK